MEGTDAEQSRRRVNRFILNQPRAFWETVPLPLKHDPRFRGRYAPRALLTDPALVYECRDLPRRGLVVPLGLRVEPLDGR